MWTMYTSMQQKPSMHLFSTVWRETSHVEAFERILRMPAGSCNGRKAVRAFVGASWALWAEEECNRRKKMAALLGGPAACRRRRWTLADFGKEFWIVPASVLCSLERSVNVDQFSAFEFFCLCQPFCWESGKDWIFMAWTSISVRWQWTSASFSLPWRCEKATHVGHAKAAKVILRTQLPLLQQNPLFFFFFFV